MRGSGGPGSGRLQPGSDLLGDVEGAAVRVGVEPAAAERLPQYGVVRLLQTLERRTFQPNFLWFTGSSPTSRTGFLEKR